MPQPLTGRESSRSVPRVGRRKGIFAAATLLFGVAPAAHAQVAEPDALRSEIATLKNQMATMQEALEALETRLDASEGRARPPTTPPTTATTAAMAKPPPVRAATSGAGVQGLRPSSSPMRETFGDVERGAARPAGAAPPGDPELRGYWQLPGTSTLVRVGGFAKVNLLFDTKPAASPDGLVTSQLPTSPGRYHTFNVDPYATRFNLDIRSPGLLGPLRIYFENDFVTGNGSPGFRLRQAYGQAGTTYAGFGNSAFVDPDALAETLDDQGPGSEAQVRLPSVREILALSRTVSVALSAEKPSSDIALAPGQLAVQQAPDIVGAWRLEERWGHVQVAAVYRDLGYTQAGVTRRADGYGLNISGLARIGSDFVVAGVAGGQGISRYLNDLSGKGYDAAITPAGRIAPLRLLSGYVGLTHVWVPGWRSNLVLGGLWLERSSLLPPTAFRASQYGAADLIWAGTRDFYVGLEGIYGRRQSQDATIRDDFRLQASIRYNLVR